ncbi:hypothetical protein L227DRAFT_396761 [Lentinus tigrinus ALCF2SS1-6]|uniref:Uncharacterized protein n=1 Tax=Lentinus tigrinus ALCF2SS1-6 TaxID=1328759 RepID=A0A5C2RPR8_9APHY|nr:hypothetical protein L227DRAFT_396761 [Lentinus tigrinus ALCF2SS1-6]
MHLATLLSNSSGRVIAATGSIKPSGVDIVIVSSGNSSMVQQAPFVVRPIIGLDSPKDTAQRLQPVTASQVSKAKIKPGSAPVPIRQHARDLFEVSKYVHNGEVSKLDAKKWVLSRCYRKLAARLKKTRTSWREPDLITLLKKWRPQANEVITGFVDVSAPGHALVAQVVRKWVVVDAEKHIPLSGDGASRFVGGCIASILEHLRNVVPASIGKPGNLDFATDALSVLQALLEQEKTKWLFTQTSLGKHLRPDPPRYVRHHPSVPFAVHVAQHDDAGDNDEVISQSRRGSTGTMFTGTSASLAEAEGDEGGEGGDQDEDEDADEDEDEDTVGGE